jgi:hypothetical protein
MGVFTDIEMVWAGKVYTIKSTRVMGAIAQMEGHLTLSEMGSYSHRQTVPLARLCQAYAAVLRYAGARVTAEEIYQFAFSGDDNQMAVFMAVMNLMMVATPADKRAEFQQLVIDAQAAAAEGGETNGEGQPDSEADPGNAQAAAAAS